MKCPKCNNRIKTNEAGYLECPVCEYEPTTIDSLNEAVRKIKEEVK